MANIDVTENLVDADFVDPMVLINRQPAVDLYGKNFLSEVSRTSSFGSVQPASGRVIAKLPEEFRVANVSSFFFRGVIVATAPGKYSSILEFKGQRYQVQTVNDWSNWGEGWCEGTCVAEVPA